MNAENLEIINNKKENRFEVTVDGLLSVAEYHLMGRNIVFTHTGVPEELEGQGIGSKLAQTGLEYAQDEGLKVLPICPFIAAYIKEHPQYKELVTTDYHGEL